MLPLLVLQPHHQNGSETINLVTNDKALEYSLRLVPGIRWNQKLQCWYIQLEKERYLELKTIMEGKAMLELAQLREYLEQRKVLPTRANSPSAKKVQQLKEYPLSAENLLAFQAYQNMLKLKGYSPRTFDTYTSEFERLLRLLGGCW